MGQSSKIPAQLRLRGRLLHYHTLGVSFYLLYYILLLVNDELLLFLLQVLRSLASFTNESPVSQMSSQQRSSPIFSVQVLPLLPQRPNCTPYVLLADCPDNKCGCSTEEVNHCRFFVYLSPYIQNVARFSFSKCRIFSWRSRKGRKKVSVKKGYILRRPK